MSEGQLRADVAPDRSNRPAGSTSPGRVRADAVLDRLPAGAVDLAALLLTRAATALEQRFDTALPAALGDADAAADHLVRPLLDEPDWPDPTPPVPTPDGGAVHADLTDDDAEALTRLRRMQDPARSTAEHLARSAQEWRLPVTPYRPLSPAGRTGRSPSVGPSADRPVGPNGPTRRTDELVIVDLTSLWAGPLATCLLAAAGARVIKIDPSARPDALADHPGLHRRLNGAKEIIDLDLRHGDDRTRFADLVAGADLVIDSFSRRVMPNFGYGPDDLATLAATRGNDRLITMSIVAFGADRPERDWVSYGPGVHAAVGLGSPPGPGHDGDGPGGRWRPAPIAYPDPLAGLTAYATAVEALGSPTGSLRHHEISLAGSIDPLLGRATT